jgi:chromosome segregation ATPase
MERLEPPAQWVSIPVQEFERLHGEIKRLKVADKYAHKTVERLDAEIERLREQARIRETRIAELDASNERLNHLHNEAAHHAHALRAENERLRALADVRLTAMEASDAENERLRADNTFAGDATERLLAGIKHVHSLVSFGFVGDAKQELEALLSGSGGSDRA